MPCVDMTLSELRVDIQGCSQRGALSLACAALEPRIQAQVLMFSGLMDNICPPSTHFAVYNNLMSSKNIVIYPDFDHEYLPDSDDMVYEFLTKENG